MPWRCQPADEEAACRRSDTTRAMPPARRRAITAPAGRAPRRARRATSRSSNGSDPVADRLRRSRGPCRRSPPRRRPRPRRRPGRWRPRGRARPRGASGRRCAGPHLLDDGSRVLAAGVVGGEDDARRRAGRRPRPSAGAWPGRGRRRSRTRRSPGRRRPARGPAASSLLEAVGRVGVVDDDAEGLAGVDRLEAAGHRPARRPGPRRRSAGSTPSSTAAVGRGERVGDVEPARPGGSVTGCAPPAERACPPRPTSRSLDVGRARSRASGSARRRAAARPVGSSTLTTARSLRGPARTAGPWPRSRPPSCRGSRGGPAEVGEHGDREAGAVDPVRGRGRGTRPPWRPRRVPSRAKRGQLRLEVGRLGRRAGAGERADHAGRPAGGASRMAASRWTTVVLPFVPVTPTTVELAATGGRGTRPRPGPWPRGRRRPAPRARRGRAGRSHEQRDGAGGRPRRPAWSWPSVALAGHAAEQRRRARPARESWVTARRPSTVARRRGIAPCPPPTLGEQPVEAHAHGPSAPASVVRRGPACIAQAVDRPAPVGRGSGTIGGRRRPAAGGGMR